MLRCLCHIQNWHTINNLAGKAFLDSSSLVWSQADSSSNISHNCCCQSWKAAGAPSLPISCPHCAEIAPAPAGLTAPCNTRDEHTEWAIKRIIRSAGSCVPLSQAGEWRGSVLHLLARPIQVPGRNCLPNSLENCCFLALKCHKWKSKKFLKRALNARAPLSRASIGE